jgi:hypothetical protein
MSDPKKPVKQTQAPDPGQHPETKRDSSAGVPDEKSSKVPSDARPDARSGQDKDGNERQGSSPKRATP